MSKIIEMGCTGQHRCNHGNIESYKIDVDQVIDCSLHTVGYYLPPIHGTIVPRYLSTQYTREDLPHTKNETPIPQAVAIPAS